MSTTLEAALREAVTVWQGSVDEGSSHVAHPSFEVANRLVPYLDNDAIIFRLCSMHQYGFAERTHTKLTPHLVATSLILRAASVGAKEAISELRNLVSTNMVLASICALVAGVSTEIEVTLCANTTLRPFNYERLPPGLVSIQQRYAGLLIDGSVSDPSCIIVFQVNHQPFFEEEQPAPDWPAETIMHLLEVVDRLSVASYRAVGVTEMWITDEDPRLPSQGSVMSFRNPNWNAPPREEPIGITSDMVEFVGLFDKVSSSAEQATLKLAAARFNRSCRAVSSADRALDMGMALEVLLMHQGKGSDGSNSEIRYKLASRAAWMLGEDLEGRLSYFDKVSSLYSDRSSAVHKGRLDTKDFLKLLARQNDHGDVIRRVFWKIGENGHFPDWKRLVLNGAWSRQ